VELEIAKRTRVRYLKRAISSITTIVEDEEEDEYIEAADEDVVDETDETDVAIAEADEELEDEEAAVQEAASEEDVEAPAPPKEPSA